MHKSMFSYIELILSTDLQSSVLGTREISNLKHKGVRSMTRSIKPNNMGIIFVLAVSLITASITTKFMNSKLLAASPKNKINTPIISCGVSTPNTIALQICGGAVSGAPAGFSVQWMKASDYFVTDPNNPNATVGVWNESILCKASFSGNANGTIWNLGANSCTKFVIAGLNDADPGVSFSCNEPLECDTDYVFRVFAHATKTLQRSDFSQTWICRTAACDPPPLQDCDFTTKSQGFYGGNGQAGLNFLIGCYGGDGGIGSVSVPQNLGDLIIIGGPGYQYKWYLTGVYEDIDPSPKNYHWIDTGLLALRSAIGGGGTSGIFNTSGENSLNMGSGGGLASQTAALTLNIAASGAQCSGFPAGFGSLVLKFAVGDTFRNDGTPLTQDQAMALNGQTIQQVLVATNAYLGGGGLVPPPYNLGSAGYLNELISQLNLSFDTPLDVDIDGDGSIDNCGISAFGNLHLQRP